MNYPPYANFPVLKHSRITLRSLHVSDCETLLPIFYYDNEKAHDLDEALSMKLQIESDYAAGNCIHWVIIDNISKEILGACGYYRGFTIGTGELGCILLPQHKGKGHMRTALQLAINFGLHTIGLHTIWAATATTNDKAKRLLSELNFKRIAEKEEELIFEYVKSALT